MSTTSETESEPELEPATGAISSLTAFAHLSATRPSQAATGQMTVGWAVDTLATLDFQLLRKDTTLHNLVQGCASTILAFLSTVLEPNTGGSCGFIPDVTSILRPPFLHLLFQYRRLFRVLATRDSNLSSTPLATVCWVDVILAKLGDISTFVAAGLHEKHLDQSLPGSLRAQREEDNLRAAIQLPDNLDMLPSMLLSERMSVAAKRLSIRLMLGRYILYPALSGQVGVDNTMHKLLSTFAEFVRQGVARVDRLHSAPEVGLRYFIQQERLTSAMMISLFAAANTAQDSAIGPNHVAPFCPQTMAAVMQLLQFVLNEGGYSTETNILDPLDHLDIPANVIIRWDIVPQWTWSIWLECRSLYADTIICLTTMYIRHRHRAGPGALVEVPDLISIGSRPSNQATVISMMIELIFRFISVLSAGGHSHQLSASATNVLHGSCRLISQWMNRNLCGIQNSKEGCKALIILFGYLSLNEQYFASNELVVECLALVEEQCAHEAWNAAVEDVNLPFLEVLKRSFTQTETALSWNDLSASKEICAMQLMHFLVVMMTKGVQPLNPDAFAEFVEAIWKRVIKLPLNSGGNLCEAFLTCLAVANLFDMPFNKISTATDEAIWHLGMCDGDVNLFLVSALSLYIASTPVSVEPLTYLEGLEYLVDTILLICSRHYPREDEPLALVVLPTVCNALGHLLEHRDDTAGIYVGTSTRLQALESVLRTLGSSGDSLCDGYGALLRRRLAWVARRTLGKADGEPRANGGETRAREHKLVSCRLRGFSHVLYVTVM